MSIHKSTFFYSFILLFFYSFLSSCGTKLPTEYDEKDEWPKIYPDYVNVTIPVNIAPLTFELDEEADEMVARYKVGDCEIICADKMQPDIDDWRELVAAALSSDNKSAADSHPSLLTSHSIQVDVFARHDSRWTHYKPFSITVSPDSIDPWLSFRLIPPSYVSYEALTISQRCLENYDESVIYDNMLCGFEVEGQCINCHNYQQYNPERMQFHARQKDGGTVIAYDGKLKRVNMRNDSIFSAGVYPAWHPWLPFIVYSTDKTTQSFHTTNPNKIEVYDSESDLITYNVATDEVCNLENDTTEYEVFPCWAPDGKMLYYCSAHLDLQDSTATKQVETLRRVEELKYNIYRKTFNPETFEFGPRELVFDASAIDSSAVLPRVSPDGRFLMFTMTHFGYFPIWHHDADLWMIDLRADSVSSVSPMKALNSPDTESYHSWSSNGRWVIFSSRRDDGSFTRPFIAHIDAEGHASRPFELPMSHPDAHRLSMKSYNVPEFMCGPVTVTPQTFADVLKGEAVNVRYAGHK